MGTPIMLLVWACLGAAGCDELVVVDAGSAATAGGATFEVGAYEARYLELSEGDEIFEYPRPVLSIPITITNTGTKLHSPIRRPTRPPR